MSGPSLRFKSENSGLATALSTRRFSDGRSSSLRHLSKTPIRPPDFNTRTASRTPCSGCGMTARIRCNNTASNDAAGNARLPSVHDVRRHSPMLARCWPFESLQHRGCHVNRRDVYVRGQVRQVQSGSGARHQQTVAGSKPQALNRETTRSIESSGIGDGIVGGRPDGVTESIPHGVQYVRPDCGTLRHGMRHAVA